MTKDEREFLEARFTILKAEIKTNHDLEMLKLESIEKQTTKTNGRVDKIEKDTRLVSLFMEKPILIVLVGLGLVVLFNLFNISEIIKLIK